MRRIFCTSVPGAFSGPVLVFYSLSNISKAVKPIKKIGNWIKILVGIILFVLTGFIFLNLRIKKKITQGLALISPAIQVKYSSIQNNLLTGSVSINDLDVSFTPYTATPQYMHHLHVPRAELKGLNFFKFIFQKQLSVDWLILANGKMQIDPFLLANKDSAQEEIFDQLKSPFKTVNICHLELKEMNAFINSDSTSLPVTTGNFALYGIQIKNTGADPGEHFSFTGIDCDLHDMNFTLPDSTAYVQAKRIVMNGKSAANIRIDSMRIIPQKKGAEQAWNAILPSIQIAGLDLMNLMQDKFVAEEITIKKGGIKIDGESSLQFKLSEIPISFAVNKFHIEHFSVAYQDKIKKLNMLAAVKMDNAIINPSKDSFNYKAFQCHISGFQFSSKQRRHDLKIQNILLNSNDEILRIHNLKIIPQYGKYEFGRKLGRQTDWVEASIPEIKVLKPDLTALLHKRIIAEKIVASGSITHIFRDRRLPLRQKYMPLPISYLKRIPFDIRVKSCEFGSSTIVYEEYPVLGYSQPGFVRIEKITGTLSPFINKPLASDPVFAIMKLKGSVMGSGSATAVIKMPLRAGKPYHMEGVFEKVDLTKLNPSSENLGRLRIKSGLLDRLYFNFLMDDKQSTGKIIGTYHNLVLQQLKKNTEERKVAGFASFMLRRIIIPLNKDQSVPEKRRTGKVIYLRDPSRFIAHYYFQSLMEGIKSSFTFGFLLPKK